ILKKNPNLILQQNEDCDKENFSPKYLLPIVFPGDMLQGVAYQIHPNNDLKYWRHQEEQRDQPFFLMKKVRHSHSSKTGILFRGKPNILQKFLHLFLPLTIESCPQKKEAVSGPKNKRGCH